MDQYNFYRSTWSFILFEYSISPLLSIVPVGVPLNFKSSVMADIKQGLGMG